ncbi:MAG: hypothetical protein KBT04_06585 [Bacteroidales bacterium]|nr:hypothetical protein [Candidatus Colimorpha onthohippi]
MNYTYVHIDCDTFFASCEVATQPQLAGKPVVVCSPNDNGGGIILALTNQAKALGLKRGIPLFQAKDIINSNQVTLCVADHKKYHDISSRIMTLVREQGIILDFIQYSIDEFFGQMPITNPDELRFYTQKVKDLITQQVGVPVSCGCSQTYTLAKTATYFAKHHPGYKGICVLPPEKRCIALSNIAIGDVWGIGRQSLSKLTQLGITSALDFANKPEQFAQQHLGTIGWRTHQEINGIPSISLNTDDFQKSIMKSKTFGVMLKSLAELEHEIRFFSNICATKLRQQHGLCASVTVFLCTNRHRTDLPQYQNGYTTKLPTPTNDTAVIAHTAIAMLHSIYRPNYLYKQAGVGIGNITPDRGRQLDLFSTDDERRQRLMQITDDINHRFGQGSISFGK